MDIVIFKTQVKRVVDVVEELKAGFSPTVNQIAPALVELEGAVRTSSKN